MLENLIRLNKKQTKVVLTPKARLFGLSAKLIQFGIPLSFIIYKYGLFSYKNAGYSATGGTFAVGIILYAFLQNTIKENVRKLSDESTETMKRAKWVFAWSFLALFVWVGSIFLTALLQLFLSGAVGVGASLFFWKPYDVAVEQKRAVEKELKERTSHNMLDSLLKIDLKNTTSNNKQEKENV